MVVRNPQRLKISEFERAKNIKSCYNHRIYENKKTKQLYLERFEDDDNTAEMFIEDKSKNSWIEMFWHYWKFLWYFNAYGGLTVDKDIDENPNREYVELF